VQVVAVFFPPIVVSPYYRLSFPPFHFHLAKYLAENSPPCDMRSEANSKTQNTTTMTAADGDSMPVK
jgi:hypothetical protein